MAALRRAGIGHAALNEAFFDDPRGGQPLPYPPGERGRGQETSRRTGGVATLNELIGHHFTIGHVTCYGARLAEPWAHLERFTTRGVLPGLDS